MVKIVMKKVYSDALFKRSRSGARINRAVISVALTMYVCMYVCMYAVTLQECNYLFTHAHIVIITRALVRATAGQKRA